MIFCFFVLNKNKKYFVVLNIDLVYIKLEILCKVWYNSIILNNVMLFN